MLAALATMFATPPAHARADEVGIGLTLRTGLATNYVWRGDPIFLPLLSPITLSVAQLDVTGLGPGAAYVGYWHGSALATGETWPFPYAGYALSWEGLGVDLQYGLFFHNWLQPVDQQHNFQATVSYGMGPFLRPRVMLAGDPIRRGGWYLQIGCEAVFEEGPVRLRLDAYGGLSEYADAPFGRQDASLDLTLTYSVGEGVAFGIDLSVARSFRASLTHASVGLFASWSTHT